jgi:sulfur carrier protein
MKTITVNLNGQPRQLSAGCSVADLLAQQGLDPTQLATAVNGEFVPRPQRTERRLHEGDVVLGFQAIVGG